MSATTPLVDKEPTSEKSFLDDPVAPILAPTNEHPEILPVSYVFSKEDVVLSAGAHSVKVLRVRPIKTFLRGNRAATEKPFPSGGGPHYYKGLAKKQRDMICLHFTAGGFLGSLGTLVMDGHIVGVPFMIGRGGVIYEMHEDEIWGNSSSAGPRNEQTIAIELVNHGPLLKLDDGYYAIDDKEGARALYCGLDRPNLVQQIPERFRRFEHWATYTDEQYDSLIKLLLYLTEKYSIPYRFLPAPRPLDPNAERYTYGKAPPGTRGIVSHVNFHLKGAMAEMKGEKWDIGPAFDWDRLTARALSLPTPIMAVGGSAAPGSGATPPPPDKTKDELRVTRKTLDRYYDHTESDTANHGGCFPVGMNTLWHGGIHLFVDGVDVHASFDGQIVAARLRTPPLEGAKRPDHYGSGAFLLLRHEMDSSLVAQLEPLLMPTTYTVTKVGTTSPGIKLTPDAPLGDGKFFFAPGDVLERADDPDTRTPTSQADTSYPVVVKSLGEEVEKVTSFGVIANKANKPDEPKLTKITQPAAHPDFSLRPGDELAVLAVPAQDDLRFRDVKTSKSYEVELVALGTELATTLQYEVVGGWLLEFWKADDMTSAEGSSPAKDDGRRPDLFKGDVLKLLHPDPAVEGRPTGPVEVEVVSLAADAKDPGSVKLTKAMLRPFTSSSAAGADEPIKLCADDKLTVVQRAARVTGKGRLDLVQLAELAPSPAVPNAGATATVKSKTCPLYQDRTGTKVVGKAKRTDTLTVSAANHFPWLEVSAGDLQGWVLYSADVLDVPLVARNEAGWAKALIGKAHFVRAFSDAELKAATPADSRALTVGTKGWVDGSSKGLKPGGTSRAEKHADKLQWRGKITFDPLCFVRKGPTRHQVYAAVVGAKGSLTFDAGSLAESRGVRAQLAANVGKAFYSLYMHLDDEAALTKDALEKVRWFPREVSSLTLKKGTSWRPASGEPVALIEGDKLRPERPWLTYETPDGDMKMFWDEIAETDLVTAIVAKAGKDPAWLFAESGKTRLMPLEAGDRLVPKQLGPAYKKNAWVEVRVDKVHDWRARGAPAGKPKRLTLTDDSGNTPMAYVQPKETVEELGASGARSYVRVATRNGARGWIATKDLGPVSGAAVGAPTHGFIQWNDALFEATTKKRSAVYAAHKGAPGAMPDGVNALLAPGFADREEGPSTALIARLEKAEVVRFPVVPKGSNASTRIHAGDPLWKSGTYAPVLPRDEATGAHGKLIHWEIFSEQNLLPARPFRPDDTQLWSKIAWPWWEAVDDNDDWTMDCKEILAMVAKGIPEGDAEKKREELVGEILNPKEIESLYKQKDVAQKLRHAACRFVLEWAVDPRTGLSKMKNAELDREWWLNLKQRFAGGPMQDWAKHVDSEWAERQAKYFAPMLWWSAALADPKVGPAGLPSSTRVWHYNPVAFLEAFSTIDLAKQAAEAAKPH